MSKMVHIAPCRFCGQTIQFESAPLTEEQEIEEATMRCDCIDAELYQMRKKQEKTALGNISALFGENAGEQNAQGGNNLINPECSNRRNAGRKA